MVPSAALRALAAVGVSVTPIPLAVTKYYELSASRAKDLSDFRARLKLALQKLVEIGFLKNFFIRNDVVHIIRSPKKFKAPLIQPFAEGGIALS